MLNGQPILGSVVLAAIAATASAMPQGDLALAPQPAGECAAEVRALLQDGRYALAEARAREIVSPAALRGADLSREASELVRLLARAMRLNGKQAVPETRRLSELAVEIAVAASGEPSLDVAECRFDLGILCFVLGDLPAVRVELEQALEQREALLGPDDPRVASVLTLLGFLAYRQQGDVEEAERLFERSRAIQEATLPPDHADIAYRSSREAIVRDAAGDWEAARIGHEEALAMYERVLRPRHPTVAMEHHNLGALCIAACDWAAARRHLEAAVDIRRSELGEDHINVAWSATLLAKVREYFGEDAEARELWQTSFDVLAKSLGPDAPLLLLPLRGMARAELASGDTIAAAEHLGLARTIQERGSPPDPRDLVWIEQLDAEIAVRRGDRPAAIAHLRRGVDALAGIPRADGDRADVLESLGMLLSRGSLPAEIHEGLELLEQALEAARREYPGDNPRPAWTQDQLAGALFRNHRLDEALAHALEAEASARDHLTATAARFEERSALSYAAHAIPGLPHSLRIAAAEVAPDRAMRAWDGLIRSRSIVFAEMLERRRLAALSRDPDVGARARALSEARKRYADLAVRGDTGQGELEEARKTRERAELALLEASAAERASRRPEDAGLEEIVRALPAGVALVSFARIARTTDADPSYVAMLWPPGAEAPVVRSLGDAGPIDERVKEALALSRSIVGDHSYRRVAEGLRHRVWDPIAADLAGAREICIVPDGALVLLDFAALPVGEDDFLIEHAPAFHYLTTERDLLPEQDGPVGGGLLAVGGPEFERGGGADDSVLLASALPPVPSSTWKARSAPRAGPAGVAGLRFDFLPRAAIEVREIAALWDQRGRGPEAVLLTGTAATEEAFEANASGREILHLATHGFFLPSSGASAASGQRGVGVGSSTRPGLEFALELSPEHSLLSGLAFAGANARPLGAGADGILLAEEISSLDLESVRLVVLSACDTGLGQVQNGEGVFGLRRAFRLAGVRTLVTSLWPVVDETAEARMVDFYGRWLEGGESVAQALRSAALRLLLDRRARGESTHPFHWAGVLAVGARS